MATPTLTGFELSPQQKRLWLLQQNDTAYVTQAEIAISGNLHPTTLKQVVAQIVSRHQILRTNFSRLPGFKLPVMTVVEKNLFVWHEIDFSDRKLSLEDLFEQGSRQTYNLEKDAILRLYLYQIAANNYLLRITLPALCADYWTLKNLFNEISAGYANYQASQPREELQYVQFSEWQNQLLSDEDAVTAEQFWQKQGLTSVAELKLPIEKKSLNLSRLETHSLEIAISSDLSTQIETIAQKYQTNTETIFLACWQILIWRLTDESSIAIGTYCDRREYEEMHSIMGLLATCLPIKSDLTGDLTFAEVLANLEKTLESVLEWQDYFSLESDDDLVFPIGFEFQELPSPKDLGAVTFSLLKQSSSIERHKLKLSGIRRQNGLFIEINYDRGYFSPDTIDSLVRQLLALLESATKNPECKIEKLSILDTRDRERIFHEFNQTTKDYPQNKSIQQLFTEQAQKTPHEIAVVFEEQQLTYAQLNSQANQLAHYLRERSVKPEVLVGLYLEKSLLSLVGLLGILKAGGAYLPLDANLPTGALGDRLEDTPIVLTQQKLVSNLPQSIPEVICLDQDWQKIASASDLNPSQKINPENLAYVLFTSGSTGKPKGVAIEQQQLLNYYYAICERLNLTAKQNFALVSSLAADLGNTVIFPALLTGSCLHLIATERASNPEALANYCDRHTIDYLKIVPSHLNALLSAAQPEEILPRKGLILGGETLNWQLVSKIQQYQPTCQIFNHYGPTETTVGVLTYQVEAQGDGEIGRVGNGLSSTVPIGKPLPNNQVYILDKLLQPVPIGVPGELYIGGAQVSRGYLNRSELTKEKFINNPFSEVKSQKSRVKSLETIEKFSFPAPSARLYKTGDKVKYLPDGNIEFLGRIDHQVKIRGYRIELGEIEFALQQHPQIKEAIAIARTDKTGKKRLVAYFVFEQQQSLNDQDLANFLQQKLPNYMIPAVWVPLKALPLNANGKVDRLALPAPEQAKSQTEKVFVAPRNPTEAILADIWAQVLEIAQVSINDNFFELGGDSILSIQIIAKVNQAGFKATPKQIFEYPTVASLAAKIIPQDSNLNIEVTSSAHDYKKFLPELQAKIAPERLKSLEDIYELTPIQKGILFHSLYDSTNGLYLFQDTFTIKASLNIETFVAAWQQVVQRHTILRTGFYWEDLEQPLQVVYQQVKLPFDYQDWRDIETEQQQEQLQSFLKRDRSRNFDLAQPCPMRLTFFRLAEDIYELVWTRHFIVADGWSVPLLLNEVVQIYQSIEEKREFSLAPSTPFRSYITWLNQQDPSRAKQFWQQMLAGIKRPTPINNLYIEGNSDRQEQYDDRQIALSPAMSRQLNTFVKQHHLTLNTLIQGVWAILLSRYSSQTEVLYGCTVSGRPPELEGVESIAGMLLNTLPVRVKVEPDKAILPWLKQLQKLLVEIRQYEYSPLVEVKAWSEIPPGLPLFESIVVFENLPQPESLRDEKRALEIIDFNTFYKINYPITVVVVPSFPLLVGVNYDFNLVDARTIDGILTHFKMLLNFIMDNPDRCLQDISLVTKEQQKIIAMLEQQVTFNFNNSA